MTQYRLNHVCARPHSPSPYRTAAGASPERPDPGGLFSGPGDLGSGAAPFLRRGPRLRGRRLGGTSRKPELSAAYGLGSRPPTPHEDPLGSLPKTFRLPLLVFGSPQDETVNFSRDGTALYARAAGSGSSIIRTSGPHLGGSHLSLQVADQVVGFIQGLQAQK